MPRVTKYTEEFVTDLVKKGKMTKRSDLQKSLPSAYNAARKQGFLDKLFGDKSATAPKKTPKAAVKIKAPVKRRVKAAPTETAGNIMVTVKVKPTATVVELAKFRQMLASTSCANVVDTLYFSGI